MVKKVNDDRRRIFNIFAINITTEGKNRLL